MVLVKSASENGLSHSWQWSSTSTRPVQGLACFQLTHKNAPRLGWLVTSLPLEYSLCRWAQNQSEWTNKLCIWKKKKVMDFLLSESTCDSENRSGEGAVGSALHRSRLSRLVELAQSHIYTRLLFSHRLCRHTFPSPSSWTHSEADSRGVLCRWWGESTATKAMMTQNVMEEQLFTQILLFQISMADICLVPQVYNAER